MDKIQKIQKAKSYLEMLANEIDPTTQVSSEDSILKKDAIKNCFLYVSNILDELIKNGGEIIQVNEPIDFNQELISKNHIKISNNPVSLSTFANNINSQVNESIMKKLRASVIKNWLIDSGYLTVEQVKVVRNLSELRITDKSLSIGIIQDNVVNRKTGELKPSIKLTKEAQEFIINNLENIVLNTETNKLVHNNECNINNFPSKLES